MRAGLYRPPSAQASLRDGADGREPAATALMPGSRGADGAPGGAAPSGAATAERGKLDKQGNVFAQSSTATAMNPQKDDRRVSAPAAACSDAEPQEDLQSLLEHLSKQSCEHRGLQEKGEARRVGKLRRDEARIRGCHVSSESWKRPSSYAREFSRTGTLPVKYLNPFEQQASTRPARSYERVPDPEKGPFWDVSTYPQIFGEPPAPHNQAPLINTARAVLGQGSPRCGSFNVELALKPWLPTYGTPRTLDTLKFVDERLSRVHGTVL